MGTADKSALSGIGLIVTNSLFDKLFFFFCASRLSMCGTYFQGRSVYESAHLLHFDVRASVSLNSYSNSLHSLILFKRFRYSEAV